MAEIEENKLNPKGILGRNAVEAAGAALIFGYQLRVVKINGVKAISPERLKAEGYHPKRWDIGVQNDIITELWIPTPPKAK